MEKLRGLKTFDLKNHTPIWAQFFSFCKTLRDALSHHEMHDLDVDGLFKRGKQNQAREFINNFYQDIVLSEEEWAEFFKPESSPANSESKMRLKIN